ncbi:hypothetical protein KI387_022075, partial [Taxus chinensis]
MGGGGARGGSAPGNDSDRCRSLNNRHRSQNFSGLGSVWAGPASVGMLTGVGLGLYGSW